MGRGTDPANRLSVIDLAAGDLTPIGVVEEFAWTCQVVAASGGSIWVLTDHGADRRHVLVAARRADGSFAPIDDWPVAVAEAPGLLLSATHCGGSLVCHYLEDAHSALRVFDLDGSTRGTIEVPGMVTVEDAFEVGREVSGLPDNPVVLFNTMSFLSLGTLWRHDLDTGETAVMRAASVHLDDERFVTELVFAASRDGTRVPMFLTRRRDVARDAKAAVWLYGYGGFTVTMTPQFSVPVVVWLERGGVYAMANLRGGGEYGDAWHDAGRAREQAERVRRLRACASPGGEGLDTARRSSPSYGGVQRRVAGRRVPHPAARALRRRDPRVGVMDMLRFHLFTIGWAWTADYGTPDDPEAFDWLLAYSPLHNLRPGTVPAHAGLDRRPRRPRRAGPLVQVRRRAAGR